MGEKLSDMEHQWNAAKPEHRASCRCGSDKEPAMLYDARHIEVKMCCDDCREEVKRGYRPEIFIDPNYYCDEEIG